MSAADASDMKTEWTGGVRVWVERAGRAVLGKGRVELLDAIDRHHSISAAARHLGMSYRRAWLLVQSMNEAAGEPLVESATGGAQGGGAHLTAAGRLAADIFREYQAQMQACASGLLRQLVREKSTSECIHVAAASSLQNVLGQLLADYAIDCPGVTVRAIFGASDELADNLLAGGPADLVLLADGNQLDRLSKAGVVENDSRRVLAENGLAAVTVTNHELPVRRAVDLLKAEVSRVALAEPTSPLGHYSRTFLGQEGIYDRLLPRVMRVDNAHSVLPALHARRADVGLVFRSDAVQSPGCRVLFAARRATTTIQYVGALTRPAGPQSPAGALLNFLTKPRAARRFRTCGFLPVRRG